MTHSNSTNLTQTEKLVTLVRRRGMGKDDLPRVDRRTCNEQEQNNSCYGKNTGKA